MTSLSYRDTKLDVPYFSQYLDVSGIEQQHRTCGMTCVYMVLKYFGAKTEPLDELIAIGEREGGYGSSGWIHDYLVKVFQNHGFACERREGMSETDVELFRQAIKDDNPVIVSVERALFDRRDFHMLVLTGIRENKEGRLEGFFYHDPASTKRVEHRYVQLPAFYLSWRHMAILPKRV